MTKTSIELQDLRRKIYIKAKSDKTWRFWGIYVHVCKKETLEEAYRLAKLNNGAPGLDSLTFEDVEESGVERFLEGIRTELLAKTYYPMRNRKKEILKDNGKPRILQIPSIRDRVVQGALKLILEPIFEADFQPGSYGYRPKRTAEEAVGRATCAVVKGRTQIIDVDLKNYFDTVRHDIMLSKVAARVNDKDILWLLRCILKTTGKRGLGQGGPLSPLLSNLYLNEVDKMLEKAKEVTNRDGHQHIEYVRWADDLIILIDSHDKWKWLEPKIYQRLQEELVKIDVQLNTEKTKVVDLKQGETFQFLGFDFRRSKTKQGKWSVRITPLMKARTKLLRKLKNILCRFISQPVSRIIYLINPILRGWLNYFRIGSSSRCFGYIRYWVEKKIRRHLMRNCKRQGFGWNRWSSSWLYQNLGLYADYQIRYSQKTKVEPVR